MGDNEKAVCNETRLQLKRSPSQQGSNPVQLDQQAKSLTS